MTGEAEAVLQNALALPDHDRADIAAELLASLETPAPGDLETVRAQWGQELERRARRVLAGETVGEDWDGLRQRLVGDVGR
jgi:hypothetical protein